MQVGIIRKNAKGNLYGTIQTLDITVNVLLRPVVSQNPDAPAYDILGVRPGVSIQNAVKIGALWEKVAKKTGTLFLQGSINDPSMPSQLRIACFTISKGEETGNLSVVWDDGVRRNDSATEDTGTGAAEGEGDGLGASTAAGAAFHDANGDFANA